MDYPKIKYVEPLNNLSLFIIFDNGEIKIYSMLTKVVTPTFAPLRNEMLFKSVQIDNGGYGIIWNDEIDLSEAELWTNGMSITTIQELVKMAA